MNVEVFKKSSAGRLIATKFRDQSGHAFVPNPLPPKIEFDSELVNCLSRADQALGELRGLGMNLPNPELFVFPFMRREAVMSSRIEGTLTNELELARYEAAAGESSARKIDNPDAQEVANYVRAMQHGLALLAKIPVCLNSICELHGHLMAGVRGMEKRPGEFRKDQNLIGKDGDTMSSGRFVPPPVAAMRVALDAFEKYIHKKDALPPLVKLALIHYQFEAIHPFEDGNGRVGRMLITLLLAEWGLLPHPLLYLSAYFEAHRQAYYDRLLAVSEVGAWKEWVCFFLEGIAMQSEAAVAGAKQLLELHARWKKLLASGGSANELRLAEWLFKSPTVSVQKVADKLDLSYPGAKRIVGKFVELGILSHADNFQYGKGYTATEIFDCIRATLEGHGVNKNESRV